MIPFFIYRNPIWNFNLDRNNNNISILHETPSYLEETIDKNVIYENKLTYKLDSACQLFFAGYINKKKSRIVFKIKYIPINDNYILLARFSKKRWLFITWIFRIIELNNPIRETVGLIKSFRIKKVSNQRLKRRIKKFTELELKTFHSTILDSNPVISVIIPTLNRYDHLNNVLKDLEKQDYKNLEIIIVDQSDNFDREFYSNWILDIKYIRQEEKALWLARNQAVKNSRGNFILLSEDDVRFNHNFISNHLKIIDFYNCDISNGPLLPIGTSLHSKKGGFKISDQFPAGNSMLKRKVFEKVGLFDRQFEKQRMGDGEFGTRCYIYGLFAVLNPLSPCIDVKATSGGLREMGSWDSWRPKSIFSLRPIPSVLYYSRKYWGNKLSIINAVLTLPRSISPYSLKKSVFGKLLSYFLFILFFPIFLVQFIISWRTATKMLTQGELIDNL